jgi:hypothetical protein
MDHDNAYTITNIGVSDAGSITFDYTEVSSEKKTKRKQSIRTKDILLEKTNRKIKTDLSEDEMSCLSTITVENFKDVICKVL